MVGPRSATKKVPSDDANGSNGDEVGRRPRRSAPGKPRKYEDASEEEDIGVKRQKVEDEGEEEEEEEEEDDEEDEDFDDEDADADYNEEVDDEDGDADFAVDGKSKKGTPGEKKRRGRPSGATAAAQAGSTSVSEGGKPGRRVPTNQKVVKKWANLKTYAKTGKIDEESGDDDESDGDDDENGPDKAYYRSGNFVVAREDLKEGMQLEDAEFIWRIDGRTLLRKYKLSEEGEKNQYERTLKYSAWKDSFRSEFVPLTVIKDFTSKVIVKLNKEFLDSHPNDPATAAASTTADPTPEA